MPSFPLLYRLVTIAPTPTRDVPAISLDPRVHEPTNVAQTMALWSAYPMVPRSSPPTQICCLSCSSILPPAKLAHCPIYTIGLFSQSENFVTTDSKCISKKPPCTLPTLTPPYMAAETPQMGYIILSSTPNIHLLPPSRVPSPMRQIVPTPLPTNVAFSNICTVQLLAQFSAPGQNQSTQDNLLPGPALHPN